MSNILASSSRSAPLHPSFTRSVIHRARPPRRPHFANPLEPTLNPSSPGTSRPNPKHLPFPTKPTKRSTVLADSGLEFHHAPPPTAPSYTTGAVPDLLRWVEGEEIRRSSQAGAPLLREKRSTEMEGLVLAPEVLEEIKKLREENPWRWTRSALMKKYDIPPSKSDLLARLAPATKTHRAAIDQRLESRKEHWGFNKRVSREARQLRRGFW